MLTLRPYQDEAIAAIQASAKTRQLVALPTGTGKTVVFSDLVRRRGGTALILAHRDELLKQAADKFRRVAPELAMNVGLVRAEANDVRAPVVIASVQTLARQNRLDQLPTMFDTVVIDEAHHATADSYRRILNHVDASPLQVGFTATPERHDKGRLDTVFDELVYARSIEEMIREGWLCNLRGIRVELEGLDLAKVKKSGGDFQAGDLGEALEAADAVEHAVAAYEEHAESRQTLAFFPTVALSQHAALAFSEAGIPADHVDGTTSRDQRAETVRQLSTGSIDVVCNVGVFTEGFDEPSLSCILVAAPTKSQIKYVQMVGRGTRTHPGKKDCLILDLAGVTDTLKVQSIAAIFGLKNLAADETVTEAQDRERDAAAQEDKAKRDQANQHGRKSRPAHLFNRDAIHWLHVGDRWVLDAKDHLIVLDPVGQNGTADWRVMRVGENTARILASNLDLGYAQGTAEMLIREARATALADTDAPWRQDPASRGQRAYLRRLGTHRPASEYPDLTKGDAADLITTRIAHERLTRLDKVLAERTPRCP